MPSALYQMRSRTEWNGPWTMFKSSIIESAWKGCCGQKAVQPETCQFIEVFQEMLMEGLTSQLNKEYWARMVE